MRPHEHISATKRISVATPQESALELAPKLQPQPRLKPPPEPAPELDPELPPELAAEPAPICSEVFTMAGPQALLLGKIKKC